MAAVAAQVGQSLRKLLDLHVIHNFNVEGVYVDLLAFHIFL